MIREEITKEALIRLSKDDPDFHLRLQALADMKENEPKKYALALSMLKIKK